MTRSALGFSSGKASRITASVVSGVAALMMPARTDETCVSPMAKSVNGTLFISIATTNRWRHVERLRGSRAPAMADTTTSALAPMASRTNATCTGASICSPSLIHQKEQPQVAASSTNTTCHGRRC